MGKRGNGEGSIHRRKDGRWEGRYTIHAAEGRKQKTAYGKTRKEVSEKLGSSISLEEPQHFSKRQLGVTYAEDPVNRPQHNAGALCECTGYTHPLIR